MDRKLYHKLTPNGQSSNSQIKSEKYVPKYQKYPEYIIMKFIDNWESIDHKDKTNTINSG